MTKKKLKKNEPDPIELKAEKFLNRSWKFVKKESIRFIRWLFFYTPENKMDATLHIIAVISWLFIGFYISQGR